METQDKNTAPGIKPADIIRILFRRKWLILTFSLLGVIASAAFYFLIPATYSSEAKLFIRYVLEKSGPADSAEEAHIRRPDAAGANIINSEVEVISSFDLALEVVDSVGAPRILPPPPGGVANRHEAADLVRKSIKIQVPPRSDVVRIVFQHKDPEIVQPVLSQLIAGYLRKHGEIHRASGVFDEMLTQRTDAIRAQLAQTEEDLRKLRERAGVASIDEAQTAYAQEASRIRQEMNDTQAEIAARRATLASIPGTAAAAPESTNAAVVLPEPPPQEKLSEYRGLIARLDSMRRREDELLRQFTSENFLVKTMQEQIAGIEKQRANLEKDYPALLGAAPPVIVQSGAVPQVRPALDPVAENAQLAALEAKLKILDTQLASATTEIKRLNEIEPEITRLQRKKELEENQYRHFFSSLEEAQFDAQLGAGKSSNIGVAQSPSPPFRESREMLKIVGMLLAGGIGLGLALAFGWEMYLNPSITSLRDLQRRFKGSVFISIPNMKGARSNGVARALLNPPGPDAEKTDTGVVHWTPNNPMQVYYEGLRDRLMTWFDVQGLTRKPKLVAVTSCNSGAGVSNIAAGLASTLSETGDGRVLLVDMNVGEGAAHSFYKGKPGLGIDDALQSEKRDGAQVQENLFVVAEGTSHHEKLPSVLPRRFTSLVPRLKASDFDYIIFDMPPVSPITMTPRLSGYMDMVLLVVEAEKTSKEGLKQASQLLADARANVATVMNKVRPQAPKWLGIDPNQT